MNQKNLIIRKKQRNKEIESIYMLFLNFANVWKLFKSLFDRFEVSSDFQYLDDRFKKWKE